MNEIIVPMNVKRCAHCGGDASIEMVSSLYRFKCNQCGASTQLCRTPDEALCKWNRRYESIVHCKDCKYYDHEDLFDDEMWWCIRGVSDENVFEVEPDGFCKWGERR